MKKIFHLIIVLFLIGTVQAQENAFRIRGEFATDAADGKTVRLHKEFRRLDYNRNKRTTTFITNDSITDRSFVLNGEVPPEGPFYALLSVPGQSSLKVIVHPGEIGITFAEDTVLFSGSPLNEEYYREVTRPHQIYFEKFPLDSMFRIRQDAIRDSTWTYEQERAYNQREEVPGESEDFRAMFQREQDFMLKHAAQYPSLVDDYVANYGFMSLDRSPYKEILELLPDNIRERVRDSVAAREKRTKDRPTPAYLIPTYPDSISTGARFIDGVGRTLEGDTVKLSQWMEGKKYVLWDFWASWCVPCIAEMPVMAELYEKYGDRGFLIIGISSDRKEENWKSAVEKHNLHWPQINSAGAGSIGAVYRVETIPHTILIDGDGVIVARGLRGEKLKEKIAELMEP